MASHRQKYRPIENRDIDQAATTGGRSHGFKPRRLGQSPGTETSRMMKPTRYERGAKNKTRS